MSSPDYSKPSPRAELTEMGEMRRAGLEISTESIETPLETSQNGRESVSWRSYPDTDDHESWLTPRKIMRSSSSSSLDSECLKGFSECILTEHPIAISPSADSLFNRMLKVMKSKKAASVLPAHSRTRKSRKTLSAETDPYFNSAKSVRRKSDSETRKKRKLFSPDASFTQEVQPEKAVSQEPTPKVLRKRRTLNSAPLTESSGTEDGMRRSKRCRFYPSSGYWQEKKPIDGPQNFRELSLGNYKTMLRNAKDSKNKSPKKERTPKSAKKADMDRLKPQISIQEIPSSQIVYEGDRPPSNFSWFVIKDDRLANK